MTATLQVPMIWLGLCLMQRAIGCGAGLSRGEATAQLGLPAGKTGRAWHAFQQQHAAGAPVVQGSWSSCEIRTAVTTPPPPLEGGGGLRHPPCSPLC